MSTTPAERPGWSRVDASSAAKKRWVSRAHRIRTLMPDEPPRER